MKFFPRTVLFSAASLCASFVPESQAGTVLLNISAGQLLQSNASTPLANGSLIQLIALTNGSSFSTPTAAAFTGSASEVVVASFALDSATSGTAGSFLASLNLDTGTFPGLAAGNQLLLRWFPTLTVGDTAPGFGTSYGEFRTSDVLSNSDSGWIYPADGSSVSLYFLTSNLPEGMLDPVYGVARYATPNVADPAYSNQYKTWNNASGNNTWDGSSVNWTTGGGNPNTTFVDRDYAQFGDTSATGGNNVTIAGTLVTVAGMTIGGTQDYTFTGAGVAATTTITGSQIVPDGTLRQQGTGTTTFRNGANKFDAIIVTAGTLQFQNDANDLGSVTVSSSGSRKSSFVVTGDMNNMRSLVLGTKAEFQLTGDRNAVGGVALTDDAIARVQGNQNALGDISSSGSGAQFTLAGDNNSSGSLSLGSDASFALNGSHNTLGSVALIRGATFVINGSNNIVSGYIVNTDDSAGLSITGANNTAGNITLGANSTASIQGTANAVGNISLGGNSKLSLGGSGNSVGSVTASAGSLLEIADATALSVVVLNGGTLHAQAPLSLQQLTSGGTIIFDIDVTSTATTGSYTITIGAGGTITGDYNLQVKNIASATEETIAKNVAYKLINTSGAASVNYTVQPSGEIIVAGSGMTNARYTIQQDSTGLSITYAGGADFTAAGTAILMAAGAQAQSWHANLSQLYQRMGELRFTPRKDSLQTWARGYGWKMNAQEDVSGADYDDTAYGFQAGIDEAYYIDPTTTGYVGVYMGYGRIRRTTTAVEAIGHNDNIYGGIYGTVTTVDGWYTDLVLQVNGYSGDFSANYNGVQDHGDFDQQAYGVSLEIGKRFGFENGLFVEPQIQGAYAYITRQSYATEQGIDVAQDGTHSSQCRASLLFGYATALGDGNMVQFYGKVGGATMWTARGRLHVEDQTYNPNLNGNRAEAGVGAMWDTGRYGQLYLGYEYTYADKYEIPWSFNAGYRYQW